MARQRVQKVMIILRIEGRKTVGRVVEDDVEADRSDAAPGQAVNQLGPEGGEEDSRGRGELVRAEAIAVDGDDRDRLAAAPWPRPVGRQSQVVEEPVDPVERGSGRQARCQGESRGQGRGNRTMVPPRKSWTRHGAASVDAQHHQRAARTRRHRDKAVLDGVGLVAHLHSQHIALFGRQRRCSGGLGRAAVDKVEAEQRAFALVLHVNGSLGYPVGAPARENDLGVDRQARRQVARNPSAGAPRQLVDPWARAGHFLLDLSIGGKIAVAELQRSAGHGDELAFAIVEEGKLNRGPELNCGIHRDFRPDRQIGSGLASHLHHDPGSIGLGAGRRHYRQQRGKQRSVQAVSNVDHNVSRKRGAAPRNYIAGSFIADCATHPCYCSRATVISRIALGLTEVGCCRSLVNSFTRSLSQNSRPATVISRRPRKISTCPLSTSSNAFVKAPWPQLFSSYATSLPCEAANTTIPFSALAKSFTTPVTSGCARRGPPITEPDWQVSKKNSAVPRI